LSSADGGSGTVSSGSGASAASPPAGEGDQPTAGRATPEESAAPPAGEAPPEPTDTAAEPGAAAPTESAGEPSGGEPPPAAASAASDAPEPQGTAPEAAPPEADPAPVDDERRVLLDALEAELGDDLVATESRRDDVWLRVRREGWRRTAEACRSVGFDYFCFLSGLDWMPSTAPNFKGQAATVDADAAGEDDDAAAEATITAGEASAAAIDQAAADEEASAASGPGAWTTGYAGGETRFQVFARLYSTHRRLGVIIKADLDDDAPSVESWSEVYAGADWHERETWEMFGFDFVGHPHLTHLYLPGEFEGFPLRKDFPLLAREVKPWPGLVDVEPMPEEDEGEGADEGSGEPAAAATGDAQGGDGS
jgi:NADH-quinone oxidoreductase subunit C